MYLDSLFHLRYAGGHPSHGGTTCDASYVKAILDKSKKVTDGDVEDRLSRWARVWLRDYALSPGTFEKVRPSSSMLTVRRMCSRINLGAARYKTNGILSSEG